MFPCFVLPHSSAVAFPSLMVLGTAAAAHVADSVGSSDVVEAARATAAAVVAAVVAAAAAFPFSHLLPSCLSYQNSSSVLKVATL